MANIIDSFKVYYKDRDRPHMYSFLDTGQYTKTYIHEFEMKHEFISREEYVAALAQITLTIIHPYRGL